MLRNNTNFPAALTSLLRDAYQEHRELSADGAGGARARLATTLKYYQYLVHSYMAWLDTREAREDPDAARGLLVYHLMGLGKTFDAIAVALTAAGAMPRSGRASAGPARPRRRVLLIAAKSLHGNFSKALEGFLDIFYGGAGEGGAERARVEEAAKTSITYVTMNAHNMADQVLAATRLAAVTGRARPRATRRDEERSASAGALDGMLVIVDEAHDFFQAIINSAAPTTNARRLFGMIMSAQDVRLMFLTGTPSAKHPFELVPCFNMLAGKELLPEQYDVFVKHFVDQANFRVKNRERLANRLVGLVSHVGYDVPDELRPSAFADLGEPLASPPGAPPRRRAPQPTEVVVLRPGETLPEEYADAVEADLRPPAELGEGTLVFVFGAGPVPRLLAHASVRLPGALGEGVPPPEGTQWLENVFVPDGLRGRGLGRSVVEEAAKAAALPLSARFRPELLGFYRGLGFRVRDGAPGADGWVVATREPARRAQGGGEFSFPSELPLKIEECEMSAQQYRQYLMAREKEATEGGRGGGGGGGPVRSGRAPLDGARPAPPMALPGSERQGGSTYYVRSRMLGNYAPPRDYMPTFNVLESAAVLNIDPRLRPEEGGKLPDDAFSAETSPKAVRLLENLEDSPGPALVYSQFVGMGGLAVVERFLRIAGYERWKPADGSSARPPADGSSARPPAVETLGNMLGAAALEESPAEGPFSYAGGASAPPPLPPAGDETLGCMLGAAAPFYSVGGADAEDKWPSYLDYEWERVRALLRANDAGELSEFAETDLYLADHGPGKKFPGSDRFSGGPYIPYHTSEKTGHEGIEQAHFYANLHLGQRKLFLTELLMLSDSFRARGVKPDEPGLVVYAGAAAGYHLPYLADRFPGLVFHLYDPAPFGPQVHKHPRLHVHRQFFTDDTARGWGLGADGSEGADRARHGRADYFVCDIRLGSDDKIDFERQVRRDMDAQDGWARAIHPAHAAILKFRLPYTETVKDDDGGEREVFLDASSPDSGATLPFLAGRVAWQCWPPRLSTETRLVVDCGAVPEGDELPTAAYPARLYESAAFTHNTVVRPWARFGDRDALMPLVEGYNGSWDSRAEVCLWETYDGLAGGAGGRTKRVARLMNGLTGALRQPILGRPQSRPGRLAGHFAGARGSALLRALLEARPEQVRAARALEQRLGKRGVRAPDAVPLSAQLSRALRTFPASGAWPAGIADVAEKPRDFAPGDLHVGPDPRPFSKPVPDVEFLSSITVARPRRADLLAAVRLVVGAPREAGARLEVAGDAAVSELLADLFPAVAVTRADGREAAEHPSGRAVARYTAGGRTLVLVARDLPALYARPERAFWACWAPFDAPGMHYVVLEDGEDAETYTEHDARRRIAPHVVYDRAWSRYRVPVSRALGEQGLDGVSGYDRCWDCTAEAHTWLDYRRAAPGTAAAGRSAGELMRLAGERLGEPLLDGMSGHGRFLQTTALGVVSALTAVLRRAHALRRRRVRGGAAPPRYAVISGEVSPDDREAVRRAFNSPENLHGDVVRVLLLSKAGAQGIDLRHGRQVHIFEPYWYKTLEKQVVARFIRIGALDALPPAERTVQPFLYLATPNAEMLAAMPQDALEAPVSARAAGGGTLPPGTTVDVAFHNRALNNDELGADMRALLKTVSIERALYGDCGPDGSPAACRVCRPTNALLFHESVEDDLLLPDPCEPLAETEVAARAVSLRGVEYRYVADPAAALGFRFYGEARRDGAAGYAYREVAPSSALYQELADAVGSSDGGEKMRLDPLEELTSSLFGAPARS